MANSSTGVRIEAGLYKPSLIDRFSDWIETLPLQPWIFYAASGIALLLVQVLFLWLDGGLGSVSLLPVIAYNALVIPYLIAFIHLLDNQALSAMDSMKSTLSIEEKEFEEIRYKLSTMPSRAPFIVGVALATFLIITELSGNVPVRYAALEGLPIFTVVYHVFDKIAAIFAGVFFYHSIRQLRLVNTIYSNHTHINLFDQKPLYAFSRLTASTAVGLIVMVYGWMLLNPELLTDPLGLGGTLFFTILAAAVFVWPLMGAYRLMEQEKQGMLRELDHNFEAVFSKLNEGLSAEDYSAVGQLNATIASLEIQHRRISAIPTRPWRPETVRPVLTAITVPLVLTIIQYLMEQVFGR
jgi:hypothetical protein